MSLFYGTISIPTTQWLWLSGLACLILLVGLSWSYRRASHSDRLLRLAAVFKIIGLLILGLCLIEPLWIGKIATSGANSLIIMADNSKSMNVQDRNTQQPRGENLKQILTDGAENWKTDLAQDFQIRQFIFDSRTRRTDDFSDLDFNGSATTLKPALHSLAQRYRARPLAGILLFTDGNVTGTPHVDFKTSNLPPVYPVIIGADAPPDDIALTNVTVSQTAFENAPVTIQAEVMTYGYGGKAIQIDLSDDSGEILENQTQKISQDEQKHIFRFRLRPEKSGILFYHLNVTEKVDTSTRAEEESIDSSEATLENNRRTIVVDRGDNPLSILYVSGRPNWEFKFLQRALKEDDQVQLVGLMRVARREPKYDWRGRQGETSNPLYRGFDKQDTEETEQFDQPVLVRLNPRDQKELSDGFPKTDEALYKYHAIILDDIDAEFFTHEQMNLMRKFVAERGGGFMMLGGMESFRQGGFERSPIADVLPVYLDRVAATDIPGLNRLNLTREGWLQPWARLYDNERNEQQRLDDMPPFRVINRIRSTKAGAGVIAAIDDDRQAETFEFPGLAVQRYGKGRAAALLIGDVWRWGMREPEQREDMNRFWRQTLRWLVSDVPDRISIEAIPQRDQVNQPVKLQVRAKDSKYETLDNVKVSLAVTDPEAKTVQLNAEATLEESGLFEATYVPRTSGGYYARAFVTYPDGTLTGEAKVGWTVDLEAEEFRSTHINRPLLESIAQQTGGRVIESDELNKFAAQLPQQQVPIMEDHVKPLWDIPGIQPLVFLMILLCFITEWTLRRRKGLP